MAFVVRCVIFFRWIYIISFFWTTFCGKQRRRFLETNTRWAGVFVSSEMLGWEHREALARERENEETIARLKEVRRVIDSVQASWNLLRQHSCGIN